MAISGVKMEGWDEFIKTVQKLPNEIKPKVMKGIIGKNMKPIAASIKLTAPVRNANSYQGKIIRKRKSGETSTESLPGNLKKSIGVKTFGNGTEITGYAGIQKRKNDGWYGFFVERGTRKIGANPFIKRASSISVPLAAENLGKDVTEYIVKNAKKLGLDAR